MTLKRLAPVWIALALVAGPNAATAEPLVGLTTSNQIFSFDSATPGSIGPLIPVTGLLPGTSLVGIDFRPAVPGQLTGVGQTGTSGAVYRIDRTTGAAILVNTIPVLTGTQFGVDFNPVPDALRIVSDAGQNLRITMGGAGVVNTDGTLNSVQFPNPSVVGAAYANNVPGGNNGQTTLYDIDAVLDRVLTQGTANFPPGTSPNTGTLFDVGPLGLAIDELVGFDISGLTGLAFASFIPTGLPGAGLYTINLATGAATFIGAVDGGTLQVRDIALVTVPLPATLVLLAVGLVAAIAVAGARPTTARVAIRTYPGD